MIKIFRFFSYQINAQTELAIRYKDKSPLENHHCRVTLDILSRPDCNILIGLPIDQQEAFRQDLSLLILATDMSRHNEILNAFTARRSQIQQLLKNVPARKPATETSMASSLPEKEDLSYLKMILIKACDVSNEIRPPKVAEPWAEKLLQEYFLQVFKFCYESGYWIVIKITKFRSKYCIDNAIKILCLLQNSRDHPLKSSPYSIE